MVEEFDAIVIGAGQAGGPLSTALANSGRKTAIIEREHVGGTCINEGCTPTKTMIASGRVAYLARRGADYGVNTGPITIDMQRVRERKRSIVARFRASSTKRIAGTEGVALIDGAAMFTGHKTLQVTLADGSTRALSADLIFINTGARPTVPTLPGLDQVPYLDSTSIMELDTVPEHLVIIGGGYIGVEFGQLFRRFGSRVTIIQRGGQLLAREDADIAEAVRDILQEDGITILFNSEGSKVEPAAGGFRLTIRTGSGEQILTGSHLLVATGRTPNTEALNLAATGLTSDKRGYLPADSKLHTSVPGIYALGDVKGGPAFTHISYDDFRIIRTNVLEGGNVTIENRLVPYTVFMDPQLGRVGMSEEEARESGRSIVVARMPMEYVARADEMDETRGFMKAIVDRQTKQILGAAVLGVEGGELMSALSIAMMGNVPYTVLRDAIFAHPVLMESFNNLFASVEE